MFDHLRKYGAFVCWALMFEGFPISFQKPPTRAYVLWGNWMLRSIYLQEQGKFGGLVNIDWSARQWKMVSSALGRHWKGSCLFRSVCSRACKMTRIYKLVNIETLKCCLQQRAVCNRLILTYFEGCTYYSSLERWIWCLSCRPPFSHLLRSNWEFAC